MHPVPSRNSSCPIHAFYVGVSSVYICQAVDHAHQTVRCELHQWHVPDVSGDDIGFHCPHDAGGEADQKEP